MLFHCSCITCRSFLISLLCSFNWSFNLGLRRSQQTWPARGNASLSQFLRWQCLLRPPICFQSVSSRAAWKKRGEAFGKPSFTWHPNSVSHLPDRRPGRDQHLVESLLRYSPPSSLLFPFEVLFFFMWWMNRWGGHVLVAWLNEPLGCILFWLRWAPRVRLAFWRRPPFSFYTVWVFSYHVVQWFSFIFSFGGKKNKCKINPRRQDDV